MKGVYRSSSTGKRCKSSFEGKWPLNIRKGIRYVKIRLYLRVSGILGQNIMTTELTDGYDALSCGSYRRLL